MKKGLLPLRAQEDLEGRCRRKGIIAKPSSAAAVVSLLFGILKMASQLEFELCFSCRVVLFAKAIRL